MTDTPEVPRMAYTEELMQSTVEAVDIVANMVRASMFEQGALPPPEILHWYTRNVALRLVAAEYKAIYLNIVEAEIDMMITVDEMEAARAFMRKQKLLGMLHEVDQILKNRRLSLPQHFDATYGGRLP